MHIGRHIVQELVLTYGEPTVERWNVPLTSGELDEVERHRSLGRAHDVSLLILDRDGDHFAVIRKRGYPPGAFRLPSGGVHPEESFVDGAVREALEETGLAVRLEAYLLQIHATFVCDDRRAKWTTHVMLARSTGGALSPSGAGGEAESRSEKPWGRGPHGTEKSPLSPSEAGGEPRDGAEIEAARWATWSDLLDEMNPRLRDSGLGGLRYRAGVHDRVREILLAKADDRSGGPTSS